jgi:hypothetical protein
MANYQTIVTDAGAALLESIAVGEGTLVWTVVKCGSGEIGVDDPAELTDVIAEVQEFDAIDVKFDDDGNPYIYVTCDNDGLETGYTRWEIGIFGKESEDPSDTLVIYCYAETEPEAEYIPPESEGASVQTIRTQVAAANGLDVTVSIDQSTVFLSLDRWADHLDGAGGVDQHPVATTADPGLMSAADKTALDGHIGVGGISQHPAVTDSVYGFMTPYYKGRADRTADGAEVNQNAFAIVKVGATNVNADAKQDTIEIAAGANIAITPDAVNDTITIAATGVAPSSHVGAGGISQHPVATHTTPGFEGVEHFDKLESVETGAEVNQNAWSGIKIGSTYVLADTEQDNLELAAGANIVLTPDTVNDKVTVATSDQVVALDRLGATYSILTQPGEGSDDWNNIANLRSGTSLRLLYGDDPNGPGPHMFFHVFNIEYGSKDGTGTITQLAIPYGYVQGVAAGLYMRGRYSGTWNAWRQIWASGNDGSGSGMDADLLDGQHAADFALDADFDVLSTAFSNHVAADLAFGVISIGTTNINADARSDTLELAAGANIVLTPDAVNDKVTFGLGLPYYAIYSLIGSNDAAAMMADGNTRQCGMLPSPGGGIAFNGITSQDQVHCLEIQVNNITAGSIVKTLYFPRVDDDVYYQIDSGVVTLLIDGFASNASANLTVPTGEHQIRLFVNNSGGNICNLYMADWLDDDIIWAAGGTYY